MSFLGSIFETFRQWGHALTHGDTLEIVEDSLNRLEIESYRGRFVFDGRRRMVLYADQVLTTFGKIRFVDVTHHPDPDGPDEWRVSLYLSALKRIPIGKTTDDVQASIVAARIVTITGAQPLAWR